MTGGCFQILLIFCNAEGQWKGNNKKKNYLTNSYALSFGCKRQERVKSAAERGEEWRYEETEGVGVNAERECVCSRGRGVCVCMCVRVLVCVC